MKYEGNKIIFDNLTDSKTGKHVEIEIPEGREIDKIAVELGTIGARAREFARRTLEMLRNGKDL
jgi:hypothetical protein